MAREANHYCSQRAHATSFIRLLALNFGMPPGMCDSAAERCASARSIRKLVTGPAESRELVGREMTPPSYKENFAFCLWHNVNLINGKINKSA